MTTAAHPQQPEVIHEPPSPDDATPVDVAVWDDCVVITSRRRLDIHATRTVVPFAFLDMVFQARLSKLIQRSGATIVPSKV